MGRKFLIVIGILLMMLVTVKAEATESVFTVGQLHYTKDGILQYMDAAPFIENGRTYVPVRYAALAMNVSEDNVLFNADTKCVTILKGDRVCQLTIGSNVIVVNGIEISTDAPAIIRNGRTMLPLRWLAQSLDIEVSWDALTQTISLTDKTSANPETPSSNASTPDASTAPNTSVTPDTPTTPNTLNTPTTPNEPLPNVTAPAYQIKGPLILVADDGKYTYLGKLTTNKYDSDSIFNEYGSYGSKYSSESIWNTYGTYGSKYSSYSPFNSYTSTPPMIIDGNYNIVGRLTVNKYVTGAVSPYEIYGVLVMLGF